MRNKYPGICYYCGKIVNKQEGHFERHKIIGYTNWRTIHSECVLKQRQEKQTEASIVRQEGKF